MNKNRLEAFSDGVFAIVITILILEIHIPEVDIAQLPHALYELLPHIFAYLISFGVIGVYWVGHHQSFQNIAKIDGTFLWLNVLLLLCISFIPFPTALLGRYSNQSLPILLYALNLMATNLVSFLMVVYLRFHPHLAQTDIVKYTRRVIPFYLFVNGAYVFAIAIGFVLPIVSYLLFAFILVAVIVYYARYPISPGKE